MKKINLKELSKAIAGFQQCKEGFKEIHENKINELCYLLPHGSGIDNGVKLMIEESKPERIIFYFEFHHMDENGFYSGWTEHNLTITPSFLNDFHMKISGKNKNMIKDYLYDLFYEVFEG
jgi:hypothetical protein